MRNWLFNGILLILAGVIVRPVYSQDMDFSVCDTMPLSLSGTNMEMILIGSVNAIVSDAEPVVNFEVTLNANANIRTGPETTYPIKSVASIGDVFIADGRNSDSSWIRVVIDDSIGWIFVNLISTEGDLTELTVLEADNMDILSSRSLLDFSDFSGNGECNLTGILLQSTGYTSFDITTNRDLIFLDDLVLPPNRIDLDGTIFINFDKVEHPEETIIQYTINVLEGVSIVYPSNPYPLTEDHQWGPDIPRTIYAGSSIGSNQFRFLSVEGSYAVEEINQLPLESLSRLIEIREPMTEEEISYYYPYISLYGKPKEGISSNLCNVEYHHTFCTNCNGKSLDFWVQEGVILNIETYPPGASVFIMEGYIRNPLLDKDRWIGWLNENSIVSGYQNLNYTFDRAGQYWYWIQFLNDGTKEGLGVELVCTVQQRDR